MRRKKQPYLPGFDQLGIKEFGGTLIKGNPRAARPVAIKRPMHIVMKSSLAKGERSLLRPSRAKRIESLVRELGPRMDVKIFRFANSGNHLHLLVQARSRRDLQAYLRAVTGLIARITLGVERGKALGVKFWDARPFTRVVEWGQDFRAVSRYIVQNTLEALGFIPYQPRKHKRRSRRPRLSAGRDLAPAVA